MKINSPKVSVCITTYNHGAYIKQALDSVLSQKTNFDVELILGEDDSTDDTREIVIGYAEKYPKNIRLFLNDRSNVIVINGRATGRWNLINNFKHASGEYVALLEGDDYWIDDEKLQKQVDFLDHNPTYSMCFTDAKIWDQDRSEFSSETFASTYSQSAPTKRVQFKDIASGHWVPTGSVVFRREHFSAIPAWLYGIPMADWGIFLALLEKGPGRFLEECTSVYRVHGTSYWSSLTQEEREKGAFTFFSLMRNQFGWFRGAPLNQNYWRLCAEKHRGKSEISSKVSWLYCKLIQKFWASFNYF